MCAVRCISNRLYGEKLKRALQDMEAPVPSLAFFSNSGNNLKYAIIFAHKGKSNASFGTVKGLLLFVCTHNINKTLCFYKINRKTEDVLSAVYWTGALQWWTETQWPHRHDKNIYL